MLNKIVQRIKLEIIIIFENIIRFLLILIEFILGSLMLNIIEDNITRT